MVLREMWRHYCVKVKSVQCLTSGSNRSLRSLGRAKARPLTKRVCRAWHLTSEVQVLVPGIRRAEG